MTCEKCGGVMEAEPRPSWAYGSWHKWTCVKCGHVVWEEIPE